MELNNIPKIGNWNDVSSRINDNFSKVNNSITRLDNIEQNRKGYFVDDAELKAAYPSPKVGWYAYVGGTGTIWNVNRGNWRDTQEAIPSDVDLSGYAHITDLALKANHGYTSNPKTLKQVDDSLAQLALDTSYTNKIYYNEIGYIDKRFGYISDATSGTNYRSSFYMCISDKNNLIVSGYSGVTNNVALAAFYDREFNFLGSYNSSTNGGVDFHLVPVESIPEGAYYVRCTRNANHTFAKIQGVVLSFGNIPAMEFDKNKAFYWSSFGHIRKDNGEIDTSSVTTYRNSKFLRILNRDYLFLTRAFSGASSSVAMVAFYDEFFNFIGYHNTSATGIVENYLVPNSVIPENAKYIKVTASSSAMGSIFGVDFDESFGVEAVSKFIDYKLNGSPYRNYEPGYIDKASGIKMEGSAYAVSNYYIITDKNNLVVTGYSGVVNNVALAAFYDREFNFLGSYNSSTDGVVSDVLIPVESIPTGAYYVRCTFASWQASSAFKDFNGLEKKQLNWIELEIILNRAINQMTSSIFEISKSRLFNEVGYINKTSGKLDTSNPAYRSSIFLRITDKNNLVVTGFSGATNNVALAAFYDDKFSFLGYHNDTTNEEVKGVLIPVENIPDNAKYIRFTRLQRQVISFSGVSTEYDTLDILKYLEIILNQTASNITSNTFEISKSRLFDEIGYINKNSGKIDASGPSYRGSLFLLITDKDNLVVSGFSGVSNQAALAAFYDDKLSFLGYHNATHNGTIYNYLIPAENIPSNAKYIRITRLETQPIFFSGASTKYDTLDLLKYIEDVKKLIPDVTNLKSKRSGKPNPDFGGHLKLINYLGNDQNIHPKVLYFPTAWNGHKWWMAYTPYPSGAVDAENPCIAVSDDGKTWFDPQGLTNPLAYRLDEDNYNSDTHLLYREDNNTIECWWREYKISESRDAIVRSVSSDGVNWGPKEYIFNYNDHSGNYLSLSVIFEDGKYKFWYCSGGVLYRESAADTPEDWSSPIILPIDFAGSQLSAWHMDVIHTDKGYEYVIQCPKVGFDNNTADLYYVLQSGSDMADASSYSKPILIVERGDEVTDRDYLGIYRASIVWQPFTENTPRTGGIYSIYYSSIGNGYNFRCISLTKGRDVTRLRGVNL